ncbi:dynamin family protein, partial [Campylobacter sp. 2018MI27]
MIKSVLKEYNEKYNISYEKGFLGDLKTLKNTLKNPNLMLSNKLINNIDNLCKHYNLPLQVGVIGQFSSGKSSLLNLLFKKDILATGARPVSVVATYINYGLNDLVLAEFENGLSELTNNIVNDQNEELNGLKSINIFTNNELLKDITLIDTPGLNANTTDEEFSKNLFNSFDALIWLSLAESAGKASEEKAIKELKPNIKKICLINQKD